MYSKILNRVLQRYLPSLILINSNFIGNETFRINICWISLEVILNCWKRYRRISVKATKQFLAVYRMYTITEIQYNIINIRVYTYEILWLPLFLFSFDFNATTRFVEVMLCAMTLPKLSFLWHCRAAFCFLIIDVIKIKKKKKIWNNFNGKALSAKGLNMRPSDCNSAILNGKYERSGVLMHNT